MFESQGAESIWASVSDLKQALIFFSNYVGMAIESEERLPVEIVEGLWGCPPLTSAHMVTLKNDQQQTLLRLVEFQPAAAARNPGAPVATDYGLFNLGFLVRDVGYLYRDLGARGFRFLSPPVNYAPFGNPVNEVILFGPDDIPVVNLERPAPAGTTWEQNYFRFNHSLIIAADLDRCKAFYGGLLHLNLVRDVVLKDGAVDAILALPPGTGSAVASFNNKAGDHLGLLCMRLSLPGRIRSARPPGTGLFQLSFQVDSLGEFTRAAAGAGFQKCAGPVEYVASFSRRRRASLFFGPDQVLIEIFEAV